MVSCFLLARFGAFLRAAKATNTSIRSSSNGRASLPPPLHHLMHAIPTSSHSHAPTTYTQAALQLLHPTADELPASPRSSSNPTQSHTHSPTPIHITLRQRQPWRRPCVQPCSSPRVPATAASSDLAHHQPPRLPSSNPPAAPPTAPTVAGIPC